MRNIMIASYRLRHEGEVARGYLADAGIGSLLHNMEDSHGPERDDRQEVRLSVRDSVRLFVREDDADRARALLDDADDLVFG